jgi:hypothetical protein
MWSGKTAGQFSGSFSASLAAHASGLYKLENKGKKR